MVTYGRMGTGRPLICRYRRPAEGARDLLLPADICEHFAPCVPGSATVHQVTSDTECHWSLNSQRPTVSSGEPICRGDRGVSLQLQHDQSGPTGKSGKHNIWFLAYQPWKVSDKDSEPDDAASLQVETETRTRERKKSGTQVFIPPDNLCRPNIVSLATRLKLTPMQQAAFTHILIEGSSWQFFGCFCVLRGGRPVASTSAR